MTLNDTTIDDPVVLMEAGEIGACVERMAREIADHGGELERIALLGILRRGRPLADRLAVAMAAHCGVKPPVGSLATTLYRDDMRSRTASVASAKGHTHFDFDVNGQTIILVDDVIFAGRTARAALDEVMDYGRPARVQLACLVDRGLRDLPIQPDYLGRKVATQRGDHVLVHLEEVDGEDVVLLRPGGAAADRKETR